jgi:hypothetical protein
MDPIHIAIFAAALPAAASAAVFLLLRRLRRGGDTPTDAGPAVALGFVAGFIGVAEFPSFPILDAWKWLFFIGLAGGVLAVIALRVSDPPEAIRWTLRAALAAFAAWATVGGKSAAWILGAFAATLALVWCSDGLARRAGASTFLATMLVVATATAVAVGVSNFAMLGQAAGGLCAALGACLVLSWFLPAAVRGAVAVVAVLLATITLNGHVYADLPVASAALLAAAVPAAWTANCLLSSLSGHRRSALTLAVAVLVAGAAASVAVGSSEPLGY